MTSAGHFFDPFIKLFQSPVNEKRELDCNSTCQSTVRMVKILYGTEDNVLKCNGKANRHISDVYEV